MCSGRPCTLLDFDPTGGGESPVQWATPYDGHEYYIRYRWGHVTITVEAKEVFSQGLDVADGAWSDEETNVFLHLISEAIRRQKLAELRLPLKANLHTSEHYCRGSFPVYVVEDEWGKELRVPASRLFDYLTSEQIAAHVAHQRSRL